MKIHTKPDAIPYCCKKPTVVPLNFRAQVKADIEADVEKGILERVLAGEPDTWCSRMVNQEKKNGKARRTVDLSYLSKRGLADSHHTPSAAIIAKRIPGNKFKSTLDCVDGYHGIELEEEDRHKTTFAMEWGKFHYKRAPKVTYHWVTATSDTLIPSRRTAHQPHPTGNLRRSSTPSLCTLIPWRGLSRGYAAFSPSVTRTAWCSTPRSSDLPGGRQMQFQDANIYTCFMYQLARPWSQTRIMTSASSWKSFMSSST